MSTNENLFKDFFNNEKALVSNMDDNALREHIIGLQTIAFEAKARLTAADSEVRERRARNTKAKGIAVSLQTDDITSNAINKIDARTKKLSKVEKEIERLVGIGVDRAVAEKMYAKQMTKINDKQPSKDIKTADIVADALAKAEKEVANEKKVFVNPFGPKIEEKKEEVKTTFVNPFAK